MTHRLVLGVILSVMLLGASAPRADGAEDATQPSWSQVKQLMSRGSYREALEALEHLRHLAPNDPFIEAYRALCEKRLHAQGQFVQLSPGELSALNEAVQQEQQAQKRSAAQAASLQRQVTIEQRHWDADIRTLRRQTQREEQLKERAARRDAKYRTQQLARQRRLIRQHLRGGAPPAPGVSPAPTTQGGVRVVVGEPTTPGTTPSGAAPGAPTSSVPSAVPPSSSSPTSLSPAMTLAPSAVTERPGVVPPAEEPEASPAPEQPLPPPLPKGAVQIFADQMHVLKDRNVAKAIGHVRVVFDGGVLTCNEMTLFTDTKDIYAKGRVELEQGSERFHGELGHYNFATHKGRFFEGTVYRDPWYNHGRMNEQIAEGVLKVEPGYFTSCAEEPPHFRFQGRTATVFSDDKIARGRSVAVMVDELPLVYFPWMTVADRQTPFFIIPGKRKPWEQYVLMGYRYKLPDGQRGTLRWDWRRAFLWGFGLDHQFDTSHFGKGLFKVYYNEKRNMRRPKLDLPKGAKRRRYRVLWRHDWRPLPDTHIVTDIQKFSDVDYRKELLFQEEFVDESNPESYISMITNAQDYTLSFLAKQRLNRFQTVDETLPQVTLDLKPQPIGESRLFSEIRFEVANLQTKRAHSDDDTDVVRVDWFQQLSYAMNLLRPLELTPKAGVRQTYYTKDRQGSDRHDAQRNVVSGQASLGADASLKLFRVFPVTTNWLGLNLHLLRHVVTPTIAYAYLHPPTYRNALLNFPAAPGPSNQITFGLENKLQTKRPTGAGGKLQSEDLARFLISLPYTFHGPGNKSGGRLGDWAFDLETSPWPWLRLESDWRYQAIYSHSVYDSPVPAWNVDLVMVGGGRHANAKNAPKIGEPGSLLLNQLQAPVYREFEPGPRDTIQMMPLGQWYVGLGHRDSRNDKTEDVLQVDWRLSEKWQIGTFHRFTWKEVKGGAKRFNNLRETQYTLTRDLHDWLAELVYRTDREYGEELFLTMTLKAYPEMPIQINDSYHQPKLGSQSSPFSPVPKK